MGHSTLYTISELLAMPLFACRSLQSKGRCAAVTGVPGPGRAVGYPHEDDQGPHLLPYRYLCPEACSNWDVSALLCISRQQHWSVTAAMYMQGFVAIISMPCVQPLQYVT